MEGLVGRTLGDEFELRAVLARGGQATVYRAYSAQRDADVAVKVLAPRLARNPDFRQRFLDEFRSLAQLHHENLIEVYRYGVEGDLVYIAMRLVPGGTLKDRLSALDGPADLVTTARLVSQVAAALQHAHDHDLVHLDIKPANVLLGRADWPLLADFGITRAVEREVTERGAIRLAGTPAYMSPEQCRGEPIDGRSDQYSLAVTAYEMLTGTQPFHAETTENLLQQQIEAPPPRPRELNPGLPGPVEDVLLRGLAKDSADRYPTIQSFGAALSTAVDQTRGVSLETKAALAELAPNLLSVLGLILLAPILVATLPAQPVLGTGLGPAPLFQVLFALLLAALVVRIRWPLTGLLARSLGAAVDAVWPGNAGAAAGPARALWRKRLVGMAEGLSRLLLVFVVYRLVATPLVELARLAAPPVVGLVTLVSVLALVVLGLSALIDIARVSGPIVAAVVAGLGLAAAATLLPSAVGPPPGIETWPARTLLGVLAAVLLLVMRGPLRGGSQSLALGVLRPWLVTARGEGGAGDLGATRRRMSELVGALVDLALALLALALLRTPALAAFELALPPAEAAAATSGLIALVWVAFALRLGLLGGWPGLALGLLLGAPLLTTLPILDPAILAGTTPTVVVGWGVVVLLCLFFTLARESLQRYGRAMLGPVAERGLVGPAAAPTEMAAERRRSAFGALVAALVDVGLLLVGYWIVGPSLAAALVRATGFAWIASALQVGLVVLIAAILALALGRVRRTMAETGGAAWAERVGTIPGLAVALAALLVAAGGSLPTALAAPDLVGLSVATPLPAHVVVAWQFWRPETPGPAEATYNLALVCSNGQDLGEFREVSHPAAGAAVPHGAIDASDLPAVSCADWQDTYFTLRRGAGLTAAASISHDWLDLHVVLASDGSAEVTETHRVLFTAGTYSELSWSEPISANRPLADLEIREGDVAYALNPSDSPPDHYARTSVGKDQETISWHFPAVVSPTVRTYTIRYRVPRAIQPTSDGSEFLRQVIIPGGAPVWRATVSVELPTSVRSESVRLESAGATARATLLDGGTAWFEADDIAGDRALTVAVRFGAGNTPPPSQTSTPTSTPTPTPTIGRPAAAAATLSPSPTGAPAMISPALDVPTVTATRAAPTATGTAAPRPTATLTPTPKITPTTTLTPSTTISPTVTLTPTPGSPTASPTARVVPTSTPTTVVVQTACGTAPILAMYYAWYDMNSWNDTLSDQPVAPYNSADRATIERQVAEAQAAGIDGFELNWWGPNNPTDTNLQTLLAVAGARGFKVTVDFDMNSPFVHGGGDIAKALTYLGRYYNDPAWFHYGGKPFIVFYGNRQYDVGTWASIRAQVDPNHRVFWMGEGDLFNYLTVFDGIHPYSIAWSPNPAGQLASYARQARAYPGKVWMATAMPGYNDVRINGAQGFAVDRANGAYYQKTWQGAVATRPDLLNITSFNEWREGSMMEPSRTYGSLYLNLTRQLVNAYRGCG